MSNSSLVTKCLRYVERQDLVAGTFHTEHAGRIIQFRYAYRTRKADSLFNAQRVRSVLAAGHTEILLGDTGHPVEKTESLLPRPRTVSKCGFIRYSASNRTPG
jgi:hypothetical protein